MKIHELIQGSAEWHAFRAQHFTASDAPAMMGKSKYKTRAQLLREKTTGITQDVDAATQRRFDDGHRFEALARPLAEAIIGDDLYPVVGSEGKFGASFDGLTLDHSINFEHKSLNAEITACATADDLDFQYHIQAQHQMMVSGAERTLFMASRWDENDELVEKVEFWIERDDALIAEIAAGWVQFEIDLATYEAPEVVAEVVATPIAALPALFVQAEGRVLTSNLAAFKASTSAMIAAINTDLQTDQDFADADAMTKNLKEGEQTLEQVKASALAQTSSIDELFRTIDQISAEMRTKRLALEKLVKDKKEANKAAMVLKARDSLVSYALALSTEIGVVMNAPIQGVVAECIKGKKSIKSMQEALDSFVAGEKVRMRQFADRVLAMRKAMESADAGHLFPDFSALAQSPLDPEPWAAMIAQRKQAEQVRIEEANTRAKIEAEKVTEQPEAADIARTIIDSAPDIAKRGAAPDSEKLHTTTIVIEHWYSDGLVLANLKQLLEERGFPVKSVRVAEQEVEV